MIFFYSPCIFNKIKPNTNPTIIKVELIKAAVIISDNIFTLISYVNNIYRLKTISSPYNHGDRKCKYC